MDSGFQLPIPVFVSGAWILDSNRQWPGFGVPWAVLRIAKPRRPDSTFKNFSDSGIPIPLHEASWCVPHRYLNLFITNRLELKMPPKKKRQTSRGANLAPGSRINGLVNEKTEMRTCRMSGKQSVGLSMHKQSRKERKL